MTVKTYRSDGEFQRKDLNEEAMYLEGRIKQMGFEETSEVLQKGGEGV